MILKDRDGVFRDVETLEALVRHPAATTRHRIAIEEDVRRLKAGDRGESSAANHMKTFFGASKNWVVIHDLRLEHDGVVAQIDHVLIGRLLDIWVCESKHVANGVRINAHGEFITFHDGRPRGMASPIEQTERHIHVLKRVLDSGTVRLPTRLGLTLRPKLHGLVLISHGNIQRPREAVPGIDMVIKSEHLKRHVTRADDGGNPFDLAKYVGFETLVGLGEQLVALHRPITFDWERRLGLRPTGAPRDGHANLPVAEAERRPAAQPAVRAIDDVGAEAARSPATALPFSIGCASCGADVSKGVRAFCLKNADRFGGAVYCMPCQEKVGGQANERG